MTDGKASAIRRAGNRPGTAVTILDEIAEGLEVRVGVSLKACAEAVQAEIVARAPVLTGNLKECFASPDAVGQREDGNWVVGLLTPELRKRCIYWKWVEFGTKGHGARTRGAADAKTGRRARKTIAAAAARPAHPFIRPAVAAARAQFGRIVIGVIGRDYIAPPKK